MPFVVEWEKITGDFRRSETVEIKEFGGMSGEFRVPRGEPVAEGIGFVSPREACSDPAGNVTRIICGDSASLLLGPIG